MLRRLDSAYRSPVFSLICECAANVSSLRAMNAAQRYAHTLERYVDDSLRISMSVNVASQVNHQAYVGLYFWVDCRIIV
jgi:ABC-type bacteriocin/lantibiotic exporter with double-glycine peptidase domain